VPCGAIRIQCVLFSEQQKIARMIDAISGTLTRDLLVLGEERRQLENLQVMFQQDLWLVGGLAHAEVPSISAA
jgi:hypothetical protein